LQKRTLAHKDKPKQRVILAVEDDPQDVELLRLALDKSGSSWQLISVPFARDAIKYLGRSGEYADENRFPRPNLIVLDLSLPGMSGMEFLAWARQEPNIPPIVILTYSRLKENRHLAEKFGAKGYFVKSPDLKETAAMIEALLALSVPPNGDDHNAPTG
jgi:DNA-binding response OmpR family regulator